VNFGYQAAFSIVAMPGMGTVLVNMNNRSPEAK